jgi:type I restriction enzyme, S subunit
MTVENVQLEEVLSVADTGTWGHDATKQHGYPVLRSCNIQNGRLILENAAWRSVPAKHVAKKRLADGDLIVTMSSGSPAHIGKCCIFTQPPGDRAYYFSNFTLRLRTHPEKADPRWLFYWLSSPGGRAVLDAMNSTTSGLRNLNRKLYLAQKIPLPSLPEQRRIAAILDKADAVRSKRQQTLDLADQFLRSAFLDMFGDPVTNPKGWPIRKLGTVLVGIEGGWSAKGEDRAPHPGEKAVLKISAVTSGVYKPEECKVVTDLGGRDVIVPRIGDVLFSRANTRELVAATCLVDRDAPAVFLPDKLWRLVPHTDEIQGPYLRFALSTHSLRMLIRRRATGTSGSMLNVSMAKLRDIPIPLPDPTQQRRFGEVLEQQQSFARHTYDAAGGCESLASALTQRAFRGDLS